MFPLHKFDCFHYSHWMSPPPVRWDFFREFFGYFRQKRVKYAIKTVIYKSWDWVRPPPLLGPNSQLLPKICFGGSPNAGRWWYCSAGGKINEAYYSTWWYPAYAIPCQSFAFACSLSYRTHIQFHLVFLHWHRLHHPLPFQCERSLWSFKWESSSCSKIL